MKIRRKVFKKMFCMHVYSDYGYFLKICISRGSVATQLRCRGTFNNRVITSFPRSVAVKEFLRSVNIWRRYGRWQKSGTFSAAQCVIIQSWFCTFAPVVSLSWKRRLNCDIFRTWPMFFQLHCFFLHVKLCFFISVFFLITVTFSAVVVLFFFGKCVLLKLW